MFRIFAFLTAIFFAAGASATQLYINAPTDGFLNLRVGPSTGYHVLTKMPHGTKVDVLAAPGKWFKVRHVSGHVGWASSKFLSSHPKPLHQDDHYGQPDYKDPKHDGIKLKKYFVHAPGYSALNLREGPSSSYKVIKKMKQGSYVEVLGDKGTWWLVRHQSGNIGWAHSNFLSKKRQDVHTDDDRPKLNGYIDNKTWNKILNHCAHAPKPTRCVKREIRKHQDQHTYDGFVPNHG